MKKSTLEKNNLMRKNYLGFFTIIFITENFSFMLKFSTLFI